GDEADPLARGRLVGEVPAVLRRDEDDVRHDRRHEGEDPRRRARVLVRDAEGDAVREREREDDERRRDEAIEVKIADRAALGVVAEELDDVAEEAVPEREEEEDLPAELL